MRKVYYESQKEYLSFTSRLVTVIKALLVFALACQEVFFLVHTAYTLWFLSPSHISSFINFIEWEQMAERTVESTVGYFANAFIFGCCLGFSIRETRYAALGYRPRKNFGLNDFFSTMLALPERATAKVYITEVPNDVETSLAMREVMDQYQARQDQFVNTFNSQYVSTPNETATTSLLRQTFRFVFSFFSRCTVVLENITTHVYETLSLTDRSLSLLAYIALIVKKEELTPKLRKKVRQNILKLFYTGYVNNNLDGDKRIIKNAINGVLQKMQVKDADDVGMRMLFARHPGKKEKFLDLQLSEDCIVMIPSHILFWHKVMQEFLTEREIEHVVDLEDLRKVYRSIIDEYQRGLLEVELFEDSHKDAAKQVWSWAIDLFKSCRKDQLAFLTYAVNREMEVYRGTSDFEEQQGSLRNMIMLYREAALTCATFDPEDEQGEEMLQHYLNGCHLLKDGKRAQIVYDRFQREMRKYLPEWEPKQNTERLLKRVIKLMSD